MTEVDQMSERKEIRRRIVFYGRVQGVGFRYRAQYAAEQYRLTGWVYNGDDGTVLMEVQGDEASIDQMLQLLQNDRYIVKAIRQPVLPIPHCGYGCEAAGCAGG